MKKTTASKKLSQKIKQMASKLKLMREQLKIMVAEEKHETVSVNKVKKQKGKTTSKGKKRRGRPAKK
jgi:hypothetical protein